MKGKLQKCGLFVASFVLSLTGLFGVFSSNAYAASSWDSDLSVTDTIDIVSGSRFGGADMTDDLTVDHVLFPDGGTSTCSTSVSGATTTYTSSCANYTLVRDMKWYEDTQFVSLHSVGNQYASGSLYNAWVEIMSTSPVTVGSPYADNAFFYSTVANQEFCMIEYGAVLDTTSTVSVNYSCFTTTTVGEQINSYPIIARDWSFTPNYSYVNRVYWLAGADFTTLDSGYEGVTVDTNTQGETYRPSFTVDVNDKKITVMARPNDVIAEDYPGYKFYWFITNATIDGEETDPSAEAVSGYTNPGQTSSFTTGKYDTFQVYTYFVTSTGEFIEGGSGYQVEYSYISVNVNGAVYVIDSDDYSCDGSNYCALFNDQFDNWTDKECDLTHILGCIENFFHYTLVYFGIDVYSNTPIGSPFTQFDLGETYGLLSVVTAPLAIIQNIGDGYYTCTPLNLPLPFVDGQLQLPCLTVIYTNYFGDAFDIYQIVTTGIIAYYVVLGFLAQMKQAKDPQHDKIEAGKL